ncbi:MAG TPA: heavy metal-binding domain-containing protein [Thermoanaerobaculia bacterium]|nr:heavy metal-binding domain-containing protein [Thermoanaerobaculia bacterium]
MKWATAAAGVFALAMLIGCGGEPSVASKSAAAFQEAQKEGTTFEGAGHDHGAGHDQEAHGAEPAPAQGGEHHHGTAPEADHSAMGHGGGHPAEEHATPSAGNEHTGHSQPAAQGHEGHNQPAQQSAAPRDDHAGHSQPAAPGHDHGAAHTAAPGQVHAGHAPSSPVAELPGEPASILRPDVLDAPAATSVRDAQRAEEMNQAMSGAHGGHGAGTYRHVDAGRGPEAYEGSEPQTPGAGPQHHDHGTATGESAAVYVCPMHPEVTSNAPGTCSKCGMALVERREE